jgi:ABC-2 type transport system permease protein
MRRYAAIFAARFRSGLQYRAAAFSGALTQVAFGVFIVSILEAFHKGSPDEPGFARIASYAWLAQATLAMIPWNPDPSTRDAARTGEASMELLKPVDAYWAWFARALGYRLSGVALRFLPCLAISALLLPALGLSRIALSAPASPAALLCYLAALPGAAALAAALTVFYSLFYFRSVSAVGAQAMAVSVTTLFSGLAIPLPLLPPGVADAVALTPFAFVGDALNRLWTGAYPPSELARVVAMQAAWTALCALAGRAWMKAELSRLDAVGG